MTIRTRFAPSPTGFMHIGNLRTALYAYLFARSNGGIFVLRIEDTDQERYVEGSLDVIYNTLDMAGIVCDESPLVGGKYAPYVQSERKSSYLEYAHKLVDLGGAYYCFCDKERLATLVDAKGLKKYDKHCLNEYSIDEARAKIVAGSKYVIRQNIPISGSTTYSDMVYGDITVNNEDLEDNVLIKSDGMPTYNFANVIDDHLMAINTVIRGTEYLSSTPKYNHLYNSFSWECPSYMHLPPIMKDAERKLSKRHGDANFDDFVKKGFLPEAIINYIALLGWSPKDNREKLSMDELIELFSVKGVSRSNSIFDENKMLWLNSEYIKEMSEDEFLKAATPFFEKTKIAGKFDYKALSKLLLKRVSCFSEIGEKINFLAQFPDYDMALYNHKKSKTEPQVSYEILRNLSPLLESIEEWSNMNMFDILSSYATQNEIKKAQLFWALRIAITGELNTPGGATEMAEILGRKETLHRLEISINRLEKYLDYSIA